MSINREAMKALPIQGYLDYQGIAYTTEHNRLRLVDHDSLVINLDKNAFYWNSRQKSGDLGDFIAAYEDVTPKEAWVKWVDYSNYYNHQDSDTKTKYVDRPSDNYAFDFSKWKTSNKTTNSQDYLVNERGFDPTFVTRLANAGFIEQGMPRQDRVTKEWQKPVILFPWFDETGKVVGLDQQGTSIDFEKFGKRGTEKKIAAGSDSQYGYNFHTGNGSERLIVFESPIDALSYAQMNFGRLAKENTTFLSLSGTDHQKVLSQLDRMNRENGHLPKELVMATDNDLAGYKAADYFDVMRFEGMTNLRQVPTIGKDWNDQLKSGVNAYKQMSIDESHKRLQALETFVNQNQSTNKAHQRQTTDQNQVVMPKSQRQARSENRAERTAQNRTNNEKIIQDALQRVESYKNDPAEIKKYLDFVANGQNYSARNTMLIYGQRKDATIVMGYKQFAERGIQVNKGETGMKIYGAPVKLKSIITESGDRVYWRKATPEQRRAAQNKQLETREVLHYPIETVFDVKQTNAKLEDLPKLLPNRPVNLKTEQSPARLENVYQTLKDYAKQQQKVRVIDDRPESIKFLSENKPMTSNGIAKGAMVRDKKNPDNTLIILRNDLPITDRISTLAHEMGHVSLHQNTDQSHPAHIKELQAELTSYVILKNMGIEPGEGSESYMSGWTDNLKKVSDYKDPKNTILAEVTKASTSITDYLSSKLLNGEQIQYRERENTPIAAKVATQQVMQNQSTETQGRSI